MGYVSLRKGLALLAAGFMIGGPAFQGIKPLAAATVEVGDADASPDVALADPAPPATAPAGPAAAPSTGPMTPGQTAPQRLPASVAPAAPNAPGAPAPATPDANQLVMAPQTAPSMDNSGLYDLASVPDMIGDSPGIRYKIGYGTVPLASGDLGIKIAEDSRPLPTDRVFFDFNYFNNALATPSGAPHSLERYTFGFEKTFFDGHFSIELRAPVDTGLNRIESDQNSGSTTGTVFGDLTVTPKLLLFANPDFALSVGVTIGAPTAPDANVTLTSIYQTTTVQINDQAVHVAPFVGVQYAPNARFFAIGYLQFDVDANGDEVIETTQFIDPTFRLRTPTLMYADLSTGYWLFRDEQFADGPRHFLTGLAPILEIHSTTGLQTAHAVDVIQPLRGQVEALNMTLGLDLQMGHYSSLTVAGGIPLTNNVGNKLFDSEFIVQFDRRF